MAEEKNYLKNKDMLKIIAEWKESGNEQISDDMAKMFMLLVKRYINHNNFRGYPPEQKEDMKGEALFQLVRYAGKFNAEKSSNPFAYYTQIVKNAFIKVIMNKYNEEAKATNYYLSNTDNVDLTDGYLELLYEQMENNRESNKKPIKKKTKKGLFDE